MSPRCDSVTLWAVVRGLRDDFNENLKCGTESNDGRLGLDLVTWKCLVSESFPMALMNGCLVEEVQTSLFRVCGPLQGLKIK